MQLSCKALAQCVVRPWGQSPVPRKKQNKTPELLPNLTSHIRQRKCSLIGKVVFRPVSLCSAYCLLLSPTDFLRMEETMSKPQTDHEGPTQHTPIFVLLMPDSVPSIPSLVTSQQTSEGHWGSTHSPKKMGIPTSYSEITRKYVMSFSDV
jgi:hypothetical protein